MAELARRPITTAFVLAAIATTLRWESGLSADVLTMSPQAVGPESWRLLTSALPHVGWLHLAFNACWTVVLGGATEARCGAASPLRSCSALWTRRRRSSTRGSREVSG